MAIGLSIKISRSKNASFFTETLLIHNNTGIFLSNLQGGGGIWDFGPFLKQILDLF